MSIINSLKLIGVSGLTIVMSFCSSSDSGSDISGQQTESGDEKVEVDTVIVSAESVAVIEDWELKTELEGFTGTGYLVWEGPAQFWKGTENIGKVGKLVYDVKIAEAGTYKFTMRTYIAKKDPLKPNTEHNDIWVKLSDADAFFAQKGDSKLYPNGSGKSPNPAGENGNGFFKAYMNTNDKWFEVIGTSDHNFHEIFATFNSAGTYTVEIAPRSDFFAFDSFTLIKQ